MPYTKPEIDFVLAAVRKYGSRPAVIAKAVNLNPRQVEGIKRRNYDAWYAAATEFSLWRQKNPNAPVPEVEPASMPEVEEVDPVVKEQERQARIRQLKEEREALQAVAGERSLRTTLESLLRGVAPVFDAPPRRPLPAKAGKDTTKETFLLVLSDFHGFEIVSQESTRGLNAYNGLIMCQRARKVVDTVISIKQKMERGGGWTFPRLVIALNGDMVSGTIHEVERHTDAKNIITASYGVGLLVAAMVQDLAQVFSEIDIYCISGNHGRLPDARKMQSKDPLRSFDTVIALTAKEVTRKLSHVRWHIPNAYAVAYDIEGWTVLQQHGDNVPPGALSVPLYGIDRQVRNLNALEAQRGSQVQYFVYSHFHNISMTGHAGAEAIVNGCFPAGTPVSVPGGVVPIETLQPGDKVFGRDGAVEVVEATTSREAEQGLIELGLKGFSEPLRGTPNHLVWAIKGETAKCVCRTHCTERLTEAVDAPRWIPMDALSPGDWVQLSTLKEQGTRSIGTDLAWVYGLFAAEGHTLVRAGTSKKHHRIVFTMHQRERTILERAEAILAPVLGKRGVVSERPSRTTSQLSFSVPVEAAEEWRSMFGHGSKNKRLPLWVYELPRAERHALVQGWIDGDGHTRRRADGHTVITATTVSQQLAWTMMHLASDGDRIPTLKFIPKGGRRVSDAYTVLFNVGQDVVERDGERFIRVCHRRHLREVVPVYDIQTSGSTFIAGGVGVHNSLIGGTEWTINRLGKCDRPMQMLVAFHEDHGMTHRWPIQADTADDAPAYELPGLWELG